MKIRPLMGDQCTGKRSLDLRRSLLGLRDHAQGRRLVIAPDLPGGAGVTALTRLANTQRTHVVQNLLVSLLYGGVFHRHPNLTVILEEVKAGWLPSFFDMCERQSLPSPGLGDWPFEVKPRDPLCHCRRSFTSRRQCPHAVREHLVTVSGRGGQVRSNAVGIHRLADRLDFVCGQLEIVELLAELKTEFGVTTMLISHDIDVVKALSDRVAVMYSVG